MKFSVAQSANLSSTSITTLRRLTHGRTSIIAWAYAELPSLLHALFAVWDTTKSAMWVSEVADFLPSCAACITPLSSVLVFLRVFRLSHSKYRLILIKDKLSVSNEELTTSFKDNISAGRARWLARLLKYILICFMLSEIRCDGSVKSFCKILVTTD